MVLTRTGRAVPADGGGDAALRAVLAAIAPAAEAVRLRQAMRAGLPRAEAEALAARLAAALTR